MQNVDIKVILLGDSAVGKTCIAKRYMHEIFSESYTYQSTIANAFSSKMINCNGKSIILGLWDTAGSERYDAISRMYYRNAAAAIVCFDLTRVDTFERSRFWIGELKSVEEDCKIYLCGTKSDLVNFTEMSALAHIKNYAAYNEAKFYITSSKTGENIDKLFNDIVQVSMPTNPILEDCEIELDRKKSSKRSCLC